MPRVAAADEVKLPPGYTLQWSGQFEFMERTKSRMQVVVHATLALVFLLLYFSFRTVSETLIVMLAIPFTLVGGVWFLWALHYDWSVAVTIGFLALAGVAVETGASCSSTSIRSGRPAWPAARPLGRTCSTPSCAARWNGCAR